MSSRQPPGTVEPTSPDLSATPDCDYSVVVPAYNEARYLPAMLQSVQQAMSAVPWRGEVVVVDNNSTDATAAVALQHNARVVFEPHNQIARARNCGAKAAKGRWLVFVDADCLLSKELLQAALTNLAEGNCCGGGAIVRFDQPVSRTVAFLTRLWNTYACRRRVAAGSFVYCWREGFEAIGGFDERFYASEEIWLSRDLKAWGRSRQMDFRVISSTPMITSARKMAWYSRRHMLWPMVLLLVFPWGVRSHRFCRKMWYHRPDSDSADWPDSTNPH